MTHIILVPVPGEHSAPLCLTSKRRNLLAWSLTDLLPLDSSRCGLRFCAIICYACSTTGMGGAQCTGWVVCIVAVWSAPSPAFTVKLATDDTEGQLVPSFALPHENAFLPMFVELACGLVFGFPSRKYVSISPFPFTLTLPRQINSKLPLLSIRWTSSVTWRLVIKQTISTSSPLLRELKHLQSVNLPQTHGGLLPGGCSRHLLRFELTLPYIYMGSDALPRCKMEAYHPVRFITKTLQKYERHERLSGLKLILHLEGFWWLAYCSQGKKDNDLS